MINKSELILDKLLTKYTVYGKKRPPLNKML